jgi:response regulator RpfG family c-di-GMP phosphodiesterase
MDNLSEEDKITDKKVLAEINSLIAKFFEEKQSDNGNKTTLTSFDQEILAQRLSMTQQQLSGKQVAGSLLGLFMFF